MLTDLIRGALYFWRGLSLIRKKGVRGWAALPIFLTLLVYGLGVWAGITYIEPLAERTEDWLPSWLSAATYLLWILFGVSILLLFGFGFVVVASLLASPFNGPLAESVERIVSGEGPPEVSWGRLVLRTPLILWEETKKLLYYLAWAVPFLVLFVVPFTIPAAPVLWFLFTAWMLAVEFSDYPMDNNGLLFREMRTRLKRRRLLAVGFGAMAAFVSTVPVLNLFVVPAGVAGATLMWVEVFRSPDAR